MSDTPTNPEPELLDDPEAGITWFVSLVSMVLMVVTVLALAAMFFGFAEDEVDRKVIDKPAVDLQELKLAQQESLTEFGKYEIENAEGETVERLRIPISRAMELVIADERSRSSADASEGTIATR